MTEVTILAASFGVFLTLLTLLLVFSPFTRALFFETVFHPFRSSIIEQYEDGEIRVVPEEGQGDAAAPVAENVPTETR